VDLLIDRGADLDRTDFTGRTALDWAKQVGKRSVIEALTRAGAK
jgi:ankyrin repeat protein